MKALHLAGTVAVCVAALLPAGPLSIRLAHAPLEAQQQAQAPARVLVAIYRVAPGKHLDFLKWMARRDSVATAAGIGATQWYAHLNGDSWDYVAIGPATTEEQDQKVDGLAKQRGLTTGFAASLEFRQFVSLHTDTFAQGPMRVAEMVSMAGKR